MTPLREIIRLFLKLGFVAFGGPAAHIAMMEDEVVKRRGWMDRQHFLDLVGATNLIPGPNSTEMTMHVGYERGGFPGLVAAGASFIGPAVLITGVLAWLYVQYGTKPQIEPYLVGIKPAVIVVIVGALWRLGKKAIKTVRLALLAAAASAALFLGLSELPVLLGGGVLGMLWLRAKTAGPGTTSGLALLPSLKGMGVAAAGLVQSAGAAAAGAAASVPIWKLGLFFLKVGAVLYGSGYVLVAFLEGGLVHDYGWLTQNQLLDAIAIGQFTPGPVLSTSTFVGYIVAGVPGAAVATLGIFLPSFVFVAILNPLVPRLRESVWTAAFLDAVNASAVALMAVVTVQLGAAALVSLAAWIVLALAAILQFRFKLSSVWVVLAGAGAGVLLRFIGL